MQQTSDLNTHYMIQPIDYKSIISEFNKPIYENRFRINIDYLLYRDNVNYVDFSNDIWNMRPEFFCEDYYKHSFIFPVILLVNNLKTIFNFIPENFTDNLIIAPKINKIIKVLSI